MALIAVQEEELKTGMPLAFALLDEDGRVLLRAGERIEALEQLAEWMKRGLYRDAPAARADELVDERPARLALSPGDPLQMQPAEGSAERYMVKVVGHLAPLSLLVTAPQLNGRLLFVREGQVWLLRGFIGQDALACRTRVIKTQLSPFPYLHLAYPENVQLMRIRKSVRTQVDVVVAIRGPQGNAAGRISDLSLGGARIVSSAALAGCGEEVRLSFRIHPGGMEIYLNVVAVVRTFHREQDGVCATGVEFIGLSEQDRLALLGVVYQSLSRDVL